MCSGAAEAEPCSRSYQWRASRLDLLNFRGRGNENKQVRSGFTSSKLFAASVLSHFLDVDLKWATLGLEVRLCRLR